MKIEDSKVEEELWWSLWAPSYSGYSMILSYELPMNSTGFDACPQERYVKLDLDEGKYSDVNQTKEKYIPLHIPGNLFWKTNC